MTSQRDDYCTVHEQSFRRAVGCAMCASSAPDADGGPTVIVEVNLDDLKAVLTHLRPLDGGPVNVAYQRLAEMVAQIERRLPPWAKK